MTLDPSTEPKPPEKSGTGPATPALSPLASTLRDNILVGVEAPTAAHIEAAEALASSLSTILLREGMAEKDFGRIRTALRKEGEEVKRSYILTELFDNSGFQACDWSFADKVLKPVSQDTLAQDVSVTFSRMLQDQAEALLVLKAQPNDESARYSILLHFATTMKGIPPELEAVNALLHDTNKRVMALAVHHAKKHADGKTPDLQNVPEEVLNAIFYGEFPPEDSPVQSLFPMLLKQGLAGTLCYILRKEREDPEVLARLRKTLEPLKDELRIEGIAQMAYEQSAPDMASKTELLWETVDRRSTPAEQKRYAKSKEDSSSKPESTNLKRAVYGIRSKGFPLELDERYRYLQTALQALGG